MKTLKDGTSILSRIYYYLLDFNDSDGRKTMQKLFNKNRLYDLTRQECKELFELVTSLDKGLI